MAGKAVFLDRDHTIIDDPGYLSDSGQVVLLPGVDAALQSLTRAGYKLVVVTNQSGVARGLVTQEQLADVHREMQRQLNEKGITLDGIYYCPHHPEGVVEGFVGDSDERKPNPGMLLRAAREMDLSLTECWMVGDKAADVLAGKRAGCRTIQVRHDGIAGNAQPATDEECRPDYRVGSLVEAARIIMQEPQQPVSGEVADQPLTPATAATETEHARKHGHLHSDRSGRSAIAGMTDSEVLHELLQHARQLARGQHESEFNVSRLVGSIFQVLAALAMLMVLINFGGMGSPTNDLDKFYLSLGWIGIAGVLQVVALTFLLLSRRN